MDDLEDDSFLTSLFKCYDKLTRFLPAILMVRDLGIFIILQATRGKQFLKKTWEFCLDTMFDIGLLFPAKKAEPHEMETHTRCVLSKVIIQKSSSPPFNMHPD